MLTGIRQILNIFLVFLILAYGAPSLTMLLSGGGFASREIVLLYYDVVYYCMASWIKYIEVLLLIVSVGFLWKALRYEGDKKTYMTAYFFLTLFFGLPVLLWYLGVIRYCGE